MPGTIVYVRHRRPVDWGVTPGTTTISRRGRELFRRVYNLMRAAASDAQADSEFAFNYSGSTEPAFANAGVAIASGTGSVGATINGVTVTATWATSDTNSCALVAAAINASSNALVQGFVTANNLTATLTLTSVAAGNVVQVCGTNFTAVTAIPNFASGYNNGLFVRTGTDATDATNLAAAINSMPGLMRFVHAVPVSNVVRLFARQYVYTSATNTFSWPVLPGTPTNAIISGASTIVASAGQLAPGAFVGITSLMPGVSGNAMTVAASGTGVSILNAETRFNRGAAFNSVAIIDNC